MSFTCVVPSLILSFVCRVVDSCRVVSLNCWLNSSIVNTDSFDCEASDEPEEQAELIDGVDISGSVYNSNHVKYCVYGVSNMLPNTL